MGSLAGVGVSILFDLIGLIASLGGLVGATAALYLYKKFGGRSDKMMVLIVALSTLVVLLVGEYFILVIRLLIGGIRYEPFLVFKCVAHDEEFAEGFYYNLIVFLVCYGAGILTALMDVFVKKNRIDKGLDKF